MGKRAKSTKGTRAERESWEKRQKKERESLSPSEQGQRPSGEKVQVCPSSLNWTLTFLFFLDYGKIHLTQNLPF